MGPILFVLLVGVIDYGRYIVAYMQTGGAVRAAVQYGMDSDAVDLDAVKAVVRRELKSPDNLVVTSEVSARCPDGLSPQNNLCHGYGKPQVFVSVTARQPFDATFLPFLQVIERNAAGRVR